MSELGQLSVAQTSTFGQSLQLPEAIGVWGQSPLPLGQFGKFSEKLAFLTPFGSHFARFWSNVKELNS